MFNKLKQLYRFISSRHQTVFLDYRVNPIPRYGHGLPPHKELYALINLNRSDYIVHLTNFLLSKEIIQEIKDFKFETDENKPTWNNGYLPGLDMVAIYGMIKKYRPNNYIEIGSGNSTKVARKSINEQKTNTKITSIDPYPRANIDHLSDEVIRLPLEKIESINFIVDSLNANDILFIDNSHRVFPNSDAMIFFIELLPKLRKGVIVHIHDIYLPYDYPQFMCDRYYNEQYVLAAYILSNSKKYNTILPNYFISEDAELSSIIAPMWEHENLLNIERHGGSYWLRIEE